MAKTWKDYLWPSWVPQSVRDEIECFWSDTHGRGPDEWARNAADIYNGAPVFGDRVTLKILCSEETTTGRYVHAWNNIGRLILDDGTVEMVSTCGYLGPTAPPVAWPRSEKEGGQTP